MRSSTDEAADKAGRAAAGFLSRAGARDYAERLAVIYWGNGRSLAAKSTRQSFVERFMAAFDADVTAEPALAQAR